MIRLLAEDKSATLTRYVTVDASGYREEPAMTILPSAAVNSAKDALKRMMYPVSFQGAEAALTAALPFLPVQGAVKVDVDALAQEIRRVDGNHDKGAAALAEALMQFLSALEPSAAREQALEEALRKMVALYESEYDADVPFKRPDWLVAALSSPDHADTGKVEGDGWSIEYEVYIGGEWQDTSYDFDGAAGYAVMYAADGLENIAIHEVRRRIVTSAPASEGAE